MSARRRTSRAALHRRSRTASASSRTTPPGRPRHRFRSTRTARRPASGYLQNQGEARWFKVPILPNGRVDITLSQLPADYDLIVFSDIGAAYDALTAGATSTTGPSLALTDLAKQDASAPGDAFNTSQYNPSAWDPTNWNPTLNTAGFSPSQWSPSQWCAVAVERLAVGTVAVVALPVVAVAVESVPVEPVAVVALAVVTLAVEPLAMERLVPERPEDLHERPDREPARGLGRDGAGRLRASPSTPGTTRASCMSASRARTARSIHPMRSRWRSRARAAPASASLTRPAAPSRRRAASARSSSRTATG